MCLVPKENGFAFTKFYWNKDCNDWYLAWLRTSLPLQGKEERKANEPSGDNNNITKRTKMRLNVLFEYENFLLRYCFIIILQYYNIKSNIIHQRTLMEVRALFLFSSKIVCVAKQICTVAIISGDQSKSISMLYWLRRTLFAQEWV